MRERFYCSFNLKYIIYILYNEYNYKINNVINFINFKFMPIKVTRLLAITRVILRRIYIL